MNEVMTRLSNAFQELYGKRGKLYFAPSRINIIGEHIDYNGGMVLPAAIEIGTYAMASQNGTDQLRLASLNIDGKAEVFLDTLEKREEGDWTNYAIGVVRYLKEAGYAVGGLDILIYGNIPNGAGLSSSASLELLIGTILNHSFNKGAIDPLVLVKLGKKTENDFIGVNSGIMDQFAIGMGKKDHAILLNTDTLDYTYVSAVMEGAVILIMSTNKRRELRESKYNERRAECDEALRQIQTMRSIDNLCQLTPGEDFEQILATLTEDVLKKRVRHVVEENARVHNMTKALKGQDYAEMGALLNASHASLKDLYEVTGPHLDAIVRLAQEQEGCYGARMTGAGFGGCAIALVSPEKVEEIAKVVARDYEKETGLVGEMIISKIGDGPQVLEEVL